MTPERLAKLEAEKQRAEADEMDDVAAARRGGVADRRAPLHPRLSNSG